MDVGLVGLGLGLGLVLLTGRCNFTAAFTHRSIPQRVCFNLEFHNRSYITSDVYTFDVSLILPFWMYLHVVTVH